MGNQPLGLRDDVFNLRQTFLASPFGDTRRLVDKFLAQNTPFLSRNETRPGLASVDYLMATGEEFAYVSDKFMTQTRIAMRYSTREGKLGWNKFFALSLPEKDD